MSRVDRWLGVGLAGLGAAVLWSSRAFPNVPGQKLGAGFLPALVGVGLVVCAVLLILRSLMGVSGPGAGRVPGPGHRVPPGGDDPTGASAPGGRERLGAPILVVASIAVFVMGAPVAGFLIVAPLCLLVLLRVLGSTWGASALWAVGGSLVVHIGFYKMLRVPLPWGWLPPLY